MSPTLPFQLANNDDLTDDLTDDQGDENFREDHEACDESTVTPWKTLSVT